MTIQISLAASATLATLANVRGGTPSRSAPVLRKLTPGTSVTITVPQEL